MSAATRLQQLAIGGTERREAVAVDVDLSEHSLAVHDRDDDLGLGFDAAGEIPRIRIHVVDDERGFRGRGSAADALAKRDAGVRRRFAEERPEHEFVPFEQVDPDPGVAGDRVLQHGDGSREDVMGSGLRGCLRADAVEDGGVCRCGHRGESFNSRKSRRRPPKTGTISSPVDVA